MDSLERARDDGKVRCWVHRCMGGNGVGRDSHWQDPSATTGGEHSRPADVRQVLPEAERLEWAC